MWKALTEGNLIHEGLRNPYPNPNPKPKPNPITEAWFLGGYLPSQILLWGHSLGTAVALNLVEALAMEGLNESGP